MSDRFPTEISIGGKIARSLVPALIDAINAQRLQHEWGSAMPDIQNEEELLSHNNGKGVLWFCYDEQSWGRFDELEKFLEKRRIPYNRQHAPRYEYDGELALFRPGAKGVAYATVNASGEIIVPAGEVQKIRNALKRDMSKRGVQRAIRKLDALCADADIEPLPAFEITDSHPADERSAA